MEGSWVWWLALGPAALALSALRSDRAADAEPALQARLGIAAGSLAFVLPLDELRDLARSAGLEWVNSDAERILVAQQTIAAEPRPVHVPRLPRPRVAVDEGPLVLVETRKDLSQLKLPFDHGAGAAG